MGVEHQWLLICRIDALTSKVYSKLDPANKTIFDSVKKTFLALKILKKYWIRFVYVVNYLGRRTW